MSDAVPETCQPWKTIQRSLVDHVNSIYIAKTVSEVDYEEERRIAYVHVALVPVAVVHARHVVVHVPAVIHMRVAHSV